ncbi:MAG: ABC transporter substrate-binding protein [Clostridia bacterium]|nr:ABC transporter substrate-binding protein [Clostridia bacterium]
MKKSLSILIIFALCVSLCTMLAGCGKGSMAQVYYLNFKPESAKAYEKIAAEYEAQTGVKVKVVTAAANTYEQTLKSEIAKKDAPTIFQVNGPIGYNEWKDYCANIKDSQLYSILSDKSLAISDQNGVYAIPYVVEGYGIIYNNEILDKYFALSSRQKKVNSVAEINNFNALKTVVEDMTTHKSELNIKGVFASTSLSSGEDWRWQTHLMNMPLYYEFRENTAYQNPTIAGLNTTDITFKYANNFKNIYDLYINNSITEKGLLGSKSVADSMAEFATGQVAMVQNGNWAWSQIAGVEGNVVKENQIKFMPIYIGADGEENQGLCVGTENYLAINSQASPEKQEASLNFLNWLFTSETGKNFVTNELGFITPFNSFEQSEQPTDPLARELTSYMNNEKLTSVPWIFTSFPSENFKTELGNGLLEYAQGSKDFNSVSEGAKQLWKTER